MGDVAMVFFPLLSNVFVRLNKLRSLYSVFIKVWPSLLIILGEDNFSLGKSSKESTLT